MWSLTWKEVWARRLRRHFLIRPEPRDRLVQVVGTVCGIHAQIMQAAELSLGVRVEGATRADVREELWKRRRLVKTYGTRGTLHVFPAAELPMWMAAMRARGMMPNRSQLEWMHLEPAQHEAVITAIGEALDGHCLTREQLGEEVARRVGSWALERLFPAFSEIWPRWLGAIGGAAVAGLLCFGPSQGNKVTFVRPDQWLDGWSEVDDGEALAEVIRRYLAAYGPATQHEFAQWFALRPGAALPAWQRLSDEVVKVDVEGYRTLMLAADAGVAPMTAQDSLRLLPQFDCYVVGGHPRDALIPAPAAGRALAYAGSWVKTPRQARAVLAGPMPVLLVDGVVAGVWQRRRSGRRIDVRVEPFGPLTTRQQERLEEEVTRIGEILQASPTLSLGPIR
ncbi:MAG TPA: winged helix DNA-binding domain-containing protein [Candidatus Dormibacteraeota bacterium]|nr:winged helix DNA-binding domain-containing protein [Candidatus Dormibacteraeota bacterium]